MRFGHVNAIGFKDINLTDVGDSVAALQRRNALQPERGPDASSGWQPKSGFPIPERLSKTVARGVDARYQSAAPVVLERIARSGNRQMTLPEGEG